MSTKELQSRIQARVWKRIAQADVDLSAIPESDMEKLVEIATDAAILEIDDELSQELEEDRLQAVTSVADDQSKEETVIWRGRPLLSISTEYVITNERLRVISGLLGREKKDIELIRIQDIDQTQTLRERVLGVGDISVRSHDSSSPAIILNNVRDPESVQDILRRAVLNARKTHGISFQEEM